MGELPIVSMEHHFSDLEDPRIDRGKLHKLLDIVVIAICAVICGADSWVEVELFGAGVNLLLRPVKGIDRFGHIFSLL